MRIASANIFCLNVKPQQAIDAHHGYVRGVAISPDGRFIATGGNIKIMNANIYSNIFF